MIYVRDLSRKHAMGSVNLPDSKATEKLGRDFAPCLFMDWDNAAEVTKRKRLGLYAGSGTGKTSLVKGIFSAIQAPLTLDLKKEHVRFSFRDSKLIIQKWFHSVEMGDVCHVDAGFGSEFWRLLKPYRERLLEAQGLGGVDIVENAETDERPDVFDAAIWIEKTCDENNNRLRQAHIFATAEFAARRSFQNFLATQDLINPLADIADELSGLNL